MGVRAAPQAGGFRFFARDGITAGLNWAGSSQIVKNKFPDKPPRDFWHVTQEFK